MTRRFPIAYRMAAAALLFASSLVQAQSTSPTIRTGTVQQFLVRSSDNLHYLFMNGQVTGQKPACAANQDYMMVRDENSAAGKTQIAMIMTAYASGKTIRVTGAGTCTRWGDGEDIAYMVYF